MGKFEKVSVQLDREAVEAAAAAGLDLSEVLHEALCRKLPTLRQPEREQATRQWYEENKEAVDSYNQFVEKNGLFSDGIRKF